MELESEEDSLIKFIRMDITTFKELVIMLAPHIKKTDTVMRLAIAVEEKVSITLRYLATGETFSSLHYNYRIGTSTIALFVLVVCKAIWMVLKDFVKVS